MKEHITQTTKAFCLFLAISIATVSSLRAQESVISSDWQDLFNGKDINDWIVKIHHYDVGENYGNTFRVKENTIEVRYDEYDGNFNDRFGHLYYKQPFGYYRLQLEYRFVGDLHPGAPSYTIMNSGVMFHSQDPQSMPKEQNWPISIEMQFLGALGDGKPRPTGNMCSPGTEVVYGGKIFPGHCINSNSQTYEKGVWVKAELIVLGDSLVTHLINGDTVLQYTQPQIGGGVVERYDPIMKLDGKLLTEGYIALQSEGQPVDFRNIRILNLEGCMDLKAENYKDYFLKSAPGACVYKE
jgi:hypothetical protein